MIAFGLVLLPAAGAAFPAPAAAQHGARPKRARRRHRGVDGESLLGGEPRERVLIEGFPGGSFARRDPLYAAI